LHQRIRERNTESIGRKMRSQHLKEIDHSPIQIENLCAWLSRFLYNKVFGMGPMRCQSEWTCQRSKCTYQRIQNECQTL
jgi:hypothetical protein